MQFKVAYGDTIWWHNVRSRWDRKHRSRHDTLLGVTRTFVRSDRVYIYRITILKLTIGVIF